MIQSKVELDEQTHKLLTEAQELAGINRLDQAIGCLLMAWMEDIDPVVVGRKMLLSWPEYMGKAIDEKHPPEPKRKRKSNKGSA